MRCRGAAGALVVVAVTAAMLLTPSVTAGAAASTIPKPFGKLICTPKYGIRLCQGGFQNGQDLRVPSFDGVPLDADLALPATGKGPFPLLVLLHGLGGSKNTWEVTSNTGGINDVSMADRGYAVLMYSARGFGTSCGSAKSRANTPGCAKGWIQLADQRYEIRDTQYLAGLLVDEGLAKPNIAVSGVSYGGGQSLELAMLKNRMRLPDGKFVPFTSPRRHIPMSVAAVYAEWPWDDLATSLVPNGQLLATQNTPAAEDISPAGVAKANWIPDLYAVTAANFDAPANADPQSNLTVWEKEIMAGEPYTASEAQSLKILQTYKSAIGIPMPKGGPAPTAIQSGWTDTLFPVSEALHYANRVTAAKEPTPMLLMFADIGHGWAQDKRADNDVTTAKGIAFLDSVMLTHKKPETGVVAIATTCPSTAPSGNPVTGKSLAALAPHRIILSGTGAQSVTSNGGNPTVAGDLNAAYVSKLCNPLPGTTEPGTAVYQKAVGSQPETLMGAVKVTASIHVLGNYPEVVGRLWDVAPSGTRQIVALGVARPSVNQRPGTSASATGNETLTFDLSPNEYTFAKGDTIELELVGSSSPDFRASNGTFTITVNKLTATLPTT